MKEFACGAVVPGCAQVFEGETVDDILGKVAAHAQADHGMETVPDEVVEQVKENIHDK